MPHLVPLRKAAINCGSSHPSKSCDLAIYTILLSFGLVFSFFVFVLFCVFSHELREEPEISGPCPELWSLVSHDLLGTGFSLLHSGTS